MFTGIIEEVGSFKKIIDEGDVYINIKLPHQQNFYLTYQKVTVFLLTEFA